MVMFFELQVRSLLATTTSAERAMSNVEWTRFATALFQDILGLALQLYIIVLVRERDYVRFASVGLASFSMALNVALMFGEKQPCMPQVCSISSHLLHLFCFPCEWKCMSRFDLETLAIWQPFQTQSWF
jgi:hypothetical protein